MPKNDRKRSKKATKQGMQLRELHSLLQHLRLENYSELACVAIADGRATVQHMHENANSPYGYYHGMARRFFTDVAQTHPLHGWNGVAVIVTQDDATLPATAVSQLRRAGMPLLAHSIQRRAAADAVLIPDWHFISTFGFREIIASLKRMRSASPTPLAKRLPVVYWRGSTTGSPCITLIDGKQPLPGPCPHTCDGLQRTRLVSQLRNVSWADVKYSSVVDWCQGSRKALENAGLMAAEGRVPELNWTFRRGVLDIDGHVNAWGLFWRLHSGSVVFRVESGQINSYIRELKPNVHYVPILPDLSDAREATRRVVSARELGRFAQMVKAAKEVAMNFTYERETLRVAKELRDAWRAGRTLQRRPTR